MKNEGIKSHTISFQAVIGSRTITHFDFRKLLLSNVVTGGATGIDSLVEEYCKRNGIPVHVIYPDYKTYGRKAPLIRNIKIVDKCEKIFAIWDGVSKGTKSVIDYAKRKNKEVILFEIQNHEEA